MQEGACSPLVRCSNSTSFNTTMNASVTTASTAPECCPPPASPEKHHHLISPSKRRAARQRALSNLLTKDMIQKAFVKSPVKQQSPRRKISSTLTGNSSSPRTRRILQVAWGGGTPLFQHGSFTKFDNALTPKAATAVSSSTQQQQQQCGCSTTSTDAGLGWTQPRTTSPRRRRTVRGVATPRSVRVPATMGATARALRLEMSIQLQIPALGGDASTTAGAGSTEPTIICASKVAAGCPTTAAAVTRTPPVFNNRAAPLHKDQMTQETMAEIEDHRKYFRSLRPKRRQIKFNPQLNDCCLTAVDGSLVHGSDSIDPTTIASCHVQNLSVQDLNIPSANKRTTVSALDDHLQAGANAYGMKDSEHCPSLASVSHCSQSVCSIRSAYEEKRILAHEQKKNKARIQKLEMDIDNNNAKADYLDELLHQDRAREEQLEEKNLELRRHIVEGINVGATKECWWGMSHQTMMAEEQRLREQLLSLDEEIAVLEDWQVEEQVTASVRSGASGRAEVANTAKATGESVSPQQHPGVLVDECLLLSPTPIVPVAAATAAVAEDDIVSETNNTPPVASSACKSNKKEKVVKEKKKKSKKQNPGGNSKYVSPPISDKAPQIRTALSRKKTKKKKASSNANPSLASHFIMTDGSTDETKSSSGSGSSSSAMSSGTKASRVWLDMKLSSPRLVVRPKRQAPYSI